MSTLYLIRHGQASFGDVDYDRLSELGWEQSRLLGEYLAEVGVTLDAVFTGAQRRQIETLTAVREVFRNRGLPFPSKESVLENFNEYDARGIITIFLPKVLERDERVREIIKNTSGIAKRSKEGRKAFQQVFEIMVDYWMRGEFESSEVESWENFNHRVRKGLERIMRDYSNGKTIAVFTSGGPIAVSLRHVLSLSGEVCIDLSWIVRNASMTEFIYNDKKITLAGFNMTPQLKDMAMITYR
mgnify:CR=1 FL=1